MSINIKDLNRVDYDCVQRIFMNTPFKEYISYIYPKTGCAHMLPEAMHFLTEVCRCDEKYVIDFEREETDDTMTVGQLLRIAAVTLNHNADEFYPDLDMDKIRAIGITIVELLLIVPFGKLALSSYQIRKKYNVREPEGYIRSLKNKKR